MTKPVNTLYSVGRMPILVEFAERMRDLLGWEPRYWVTQPELEDAVRHAFPAAIRHPFRDANRGVPAPGCEALAATPLDSGLLEGSGDLAYTALRIIDRHVLADSLSATERRAHLHRVTSYCLAVVDMLRLRLFVLNSTPHSIIDICFYLACRVRGIDVRMLHMTGFAGMQVVLNDAEKRPPGIKEAFAALTADPSAHIDLSERGQEELMKLADRSNPRDPWYVTAQKVREDKFRHLYEAADLILDKRLVDTSRVDLSRPLEVRKSALGGRKIGIPGSRWRMVNIFARRSGPKHDEPMARTFARPGAGFEARDITWREYYIYRDWALLKKRALQRTYEALSREFDLRRLDVEPYVYFPLHYQPERTTCPEGGIFENQFLAARVLAESLPEGWTLLVKEHPSQFLWQTEGELGRSDDYYEPFLNLARTAFVPLDLSSHILIAKARAVATITGMAGWEACTRGRPVLTFGEPWYAACTGVIAVKTVEATKAALARIEAGYGPSVEATRRFAAAVEAVGRRCYMNPSHAPLYPDLSDEANCAALVDLFVSSHAAVDAGTRSALMDSEA